MKQKFSKSLIMPLACVAITSITLASCGGGSSNNSANQNSTSNAEAKEEVKSSGSEVGIGQVLKTQYFEITVNKVETSNRVNTGNQFVNKEPEKGNKFLIMDVSMKNIDSESRMLDAGTVIINYNGKDYQFDKAETILLEGWGLLLDQINPLTTKNTKLVYKIPDEITGEAKWNPGRTDSDELINLGTIK
jgi:hypothetical protein